MALPCQGMNGVNTRAPRAPVWPPVSLHKFCVKEESEVLHDLLFVSPCNRQFGISDHLSRWRFLDAQEHRSEEIHISFQRAVPRAIGFPSTQIPGHSGHS